MDRYVLLDLPMSRVVAGNIGNAAAWNVNNYGGHLARHHVAPVAYGMMRDLLVMPEVMRAHLAALLMADNREPMPALDKEPA